MSRVGLCRFVSLYTHAHTQVVAEIWFGSTRDVSVITTTLSHIRNMFTGVTLGYRYKMRFAYAHFPVGVTVEAGKIEIRNFLGEKRMRVVQLPEGVKVCPQHLIFPPPPHTQYTPQASRTEASVMKDELVLEGNCINEVSQTAAQVHGVTLVKRKDIRKFLDGIYVSEKSTITQ